MCSCLSSVHVSRQRFSVDLLVDAVLADHVYVVGDGTGLPDESEILPSNVLHGHRVDQPRHVHLVLDVNHMRYVPDTWSTTLASADYNNNLSF